MWQMLPFRRRTALKELVTEWVLTYAGGSSRYSPVPRHHPPHHSCLASGLSLPTKNRAALADKNYQELLASQRTRRKLEEARREISQEENSRQLATTMATLVTCDQFVRAFKAVKVLKYLPVVLRAAAISVKFPDVKIDAPERKSFRQWKRW